MMEPTLALQKAILARLKADSGVTDLVAGSIFDRHARPERFPCIIIGEDTVAEEALTYGDRVLTAFPTLHVWSGTDNFVEVKRIAGAVSQALRAPLTVDDHHVITMGLRNVRYLRDPDLLSHAVVTFEAMLMEVV